MPAGGDQDHPLPFFLPHEVGNGSAFAGRVADFAGDDNPVGGNPAGDRDVARVLALKAGAVLPRDSSAGEDQGRGLAGLVKANAAFQAFDRISQVHQIPGLGRRAEDATEDHNGVGWFDFVDRDRRVVGLQPADEALGDDVDAREIEDCPRRKNWPATAPPNGEDQEKENEPEREEKNGEKFMEKKHGWGKRARRWEGERG